MIEHSFECALQLFGIRPHRLTATLAVWKCHDAVDTSGSTVSAKLSAINSAVCAAQLLAATTAI